MGLILYKYNSHTTRYLIESLSPALHTLTASPLDSVSGVIQKVENLKINKTCFLFHFDITESGKIPGEREKLCDALEKSGIEVLNGKLINVSKSFIHQTVGRLGLPSAKAGRQGDPEEWLFIKTDRNAGGSAELRISPEDRQLLGIPEQPVKLGPSRGYHIKKRKDIPRSTWENPAFLVEKYISNSRHIFLRAYVLRNQLVISESRDEALVKRMGHQQGTRVNHLLSRNKLVEAPFPWITEAARITDQVCQHIGMDYGCLDFVMDENFLPYFIDLNPTPIWGAENSPQVVNHLRIGANEYEKA